MFNEITKKAILEAIKHPGDIDMQMVDAQQARRVLDRLVGYKISPILWDKVRRGLSAGRVQSVALKLICDREREIEAFVPEEYWHITARLAGRAAARVRRAAGRARATRPPRSRTKPRPRPILADLERATFVVSSVATKEREEALRAAVHHQQAAAGVALPGQEDDDGGAAAVRRHRAAGRRGAGRAHHLHAHRLGPRRRSGARRSARAHQRRSSATPTCPSSRTATRSRRRRRTRTKRFGRRR